MDLNNLVRSDEGMSISLSMPSGPCFGNFLASESSVERRVIDTPSSSPSSLDLLHQVNAPSYSHASDALPSQLLSDYDVCHDSPQELQDVIKQTLRPDVYTELLNSTQQLAEDYKISERSRTSSVIDLSVCPGSEVLPGIVQCDRSLSSLPGLCLAHTDGHEPSLPPPMILASNEGTYDDRHEHTPIDFAPDHDSISQIDYSEASHLFHAPSPDSASQDLGIEDFNSSLPSSPSMSSAYMLSSSPIPSSSPPPQSSFLTPPTSPPPSPVKDTQVDIESSELSISGTHHKFKNISMDERYAAIPLSGLAGQHIQSMVSPDGSSLPLQHQAYRVAEDSSNTVALSNDATTNAEQRKLDTSDMDAHRLNFRNGVPHPKRPTIAAHRLQQKKLAKPFRSPVLPQAPKLESKPKASLTDLRADAVLSTPKEGGSQDHVPFSSDSKIKYRTTRAGTQFKSPMSASNALDNSSLVRLTPTIQALERKLQILKRAVKVREDVQEEVLEGLVRKWTEAGREVAWEVWNLVKDNASSDEGHVNSQSSKKRTFKSSWGWESPGDAKRPRSEEMERNWGWDVVPISSRSEEEEEEEAPRHTLGTMLRQLGVAADTLGWDDEEDSFIDRY